MYQRFRLGIQKVRRIGLVVIPPTRSSIASHCLGIAGVATVSQVLVRVKLIGFRGRVDTRMMARGSTKLFLAGRYGPEKKTSK